MTWVFYAPPYVYGEHDNSGERWGEGERGQRWSRDGERQSPEQTREIKGRLAGWSERFECTFSLFISPTLVTHPSQLTVTCMT